MNRAFKLILLTRSFYSNCLLSMFINETKMACDAAGSVVLAQDRSKHALFFETSSLINRVVSGKRI